MSEEWSNWDIVLSGEKFVAQKSLRKMIAMHSTSKAHIMVERILKERMKSKIHMATGKSMAQYKAVMEKCLEDRPYTDYEAMLDLQERNGIEIGITLHSRWSCNAMVDIIAKTMRLSTIDEITANDKMIAFIIDGSTSLAKASCLIVNDFPLNIFLGILLLEGQDAENICKCLLEFLNKNDITHEYRPRHCVAFTSDGASTMVGIVKGVAIKFKAKYPQIVTWYCLNHRLELAVSGTTKSVERVSPIKSFFSKIYAI